ncbi:MULTISPECIES: lytic transglycosylase domain-containing protein [Streptomycetaceae]|uniref:Secreted protein n=1 Tax=Streptantibioticus cattleyicolor (strain ATCC 35852 / DSM 46488 / JCM 4925 / NBRC 14057 / NRRL 8057) TaxID=1003195 RepID=F8JXU4_STREN|nr:MULTISPECIES: lytic transglycosylase domain-containing protein [Streptomycetaceae]AEW93502.1 secreted protein [Streptantibioticus cattleyicolor NRRL 8057 = DSM 46488]MYS58212.1 hypothetical protein [Streptomyces sp. SID5468]CCB73854.1 putative secreted protein [Streptantibioticus cattleyicolor NRRL 8057 = DSM 46488]
MAARFGRRVRNGVLSTAVAAAAMAALTASQPPGLASAAHGTTDPAPPPGTPIDGGSPYITDLPPLKSPHPGGGSGGHGPTAGPGAGVGGAGLPATVFAAYRNAEAKVAQSRPGCHLPWELLAGIGQVESGQADNGDVDAAGTTLRPILGPVLDGNGFANIPDTDGGRYDGDPLHDRAVGPMQFIPSTWAAWGADGNGDGVKDPNNIFDAALAAGNYLCAAGGDLSVSKNMDRAILGYNHSLDYLHTVRAWYDYFRKGAHDVPDEPVGGPGTVLPPALPSAGPSPSASTPAAHGGGGKGHGGSSGSSPVAQPTVSVSGSIGPAPSHPGGGKHPSPSPTATCPVPSASASASGSASPTATPTPSATPTVTPSPSPSTSGSPSPTPTPCASSPSPSSARGSASPSVKAQPSPSAS